MKTDQYKLSFTGAGLSISGSIKIAEAYLQLRHWDAVKDKVKTENLLQARTQSSIQRFFQELAPRLQQLTDEQLELLVEGNHQEQRQILWYAICRRYAFIREFATEVLHEKYLSLDYELTEFDYEAFFNRKADWHAELDHLKESTRIKVRTVLFRMLREAELISNEHMIIPTVLSRRMVDVLATADMSAADSAAGLQIFPTSITDRPSIADMPG
ncbi:MAG: DUF1819 family protein [Chloroflexi bacterium]|nr:DUF1819 family protein [Chloroflexota bacterium]